MITHRTPSSRMHFATRQAIGLVMACAGVSAEADTFPPRSHRVGSAADVPARSAPPQAGISVGGKQLQTATAAVAMTAAAATTATVTSCADDGPGSLRAAVATNAAIVDMTALACSTISLTTGAIVVDNAVPYITLNGPTDHALTIDANHNSRVITKNGEGLLTLDHVKLTNGFPLDDVGGCVLATGSAKLQNCTISDCTLDFDAIALKGGAIYVRADLTLNDSVVSGSVIQTPSAVYAWGGGAYVPGKLVMNHSAIRDNTAFASNGIASGGGAYVVGDAQLYASTISGNIAAYEGGLNVLGRATINNSTISSNSASLVGGFYVNGPLVLDNSTVALNTHTSIGFGAGIYAKAGMIAHSSIVANNMCTTSGQHCEILCQSCLVTGSNNLIMGANGALPFGTIVVDPVLGPLANNGGPTRTHALLAGSPAINNGSNIHDFPLDQRAFPRSLGSAPDIGAFESGPDVIFADGFD